MAIGSLSSGSTLFAKPFVWSVELKGLIVNSKENIFTFTIAWANAAGNNLIIFFPEYCLPLEAVCLKCQSLFSRKNKKYIYFKMVSAEFSSRMLSIKENYFLLLFCITGTVGIWWYFPGVLDQTSEIF